jgi:hypothetical protein
MNTQIDNSKRPALPTASEMMDYYRRNNREVVGYRAFRFVDTNWLQWSSFTSCEETDTLNKFESAGCLLSPVYADEVK